MFCTKCGVSLLDRDRFCSQCGFPTGRGVDPVNQEKRLTRSVDDKMAAGVCGGVAKYLGLDPVLVRLFWVALAFWPPSIGIPAYIVCWIVMPKEQPIPFPAPPPVPQVRPPQPAPTPAT